jgi:hypothetical protein
MAQKEVSFKIKVNGEELKVTGKQIDVFKGQIKSMRDELTKLGARTAENAEIFDKLIGDLNALEEAFGETKTEVIQTGDAIQEMGDQEEEASKQTKSYAAEIKKLKIELAGLGERTAENAVDYDRLQGRIRELRGAQDDLNRGTQELDDALSALPGPIGIVGRVVKSAADGFNNAKAAFKGLTEVFPLLRNAIAATGIGALVIVLGLIVAAVMKAAKSFEPLQTAFGKFGKVIDIVMKGIKPLTDFILNAFVGAIEFAAKAIAFLTGNLEEYNKAAADEEANAKLEKNLKKQQLFFEANGDKYDEFTQRKLKADIDYNAKVVELREMYKNGEIKTLEELNALIKQFAERRNREILDADKDRGKKADELSKAAGEKQKAAQERALQARRDYENKLRELQQGNALLRIADENDRARKALEQQQLNETIAIKASVKGRENRRILLLEVDEKYRLQLKNLNDKIKQDEINALIEFDTELEKLRIEANNSTLEAERQFFILQLGQERTALIKRLNELKIYGEERDKALANFNTIEQERLRKFDEQVIINQILSYKSQLKLQEQYNTAVIELDNQLAANEILTESKFRVAYSKEYQQFLSDNLVALGDKYENEYDLISQSLEEQNKLADENYNKGKLSLFEFNRLKEDLRQQDYQNEVTYIQRQIALDQLLLQSKQASADKTVEIASNAAGLLGAIAGESLELQKAAAIADAGVAIARIIIDTQRANVAFTASVAPLGPAGVPIAAAYTVKNTIAAALAVAAITAQGIQKLVSINTSQFKTGGAAGGSTGGTQYADGRFRGYAEGGMIEGKRHAQGGTIIEAEAGEAIMTRGAVTLFGPLLSAMNAMGGGTSFGSTMVSTYDKPKSETNGEQTTIIKTYVVETDLTSAQQKQARLKDLSTL